jgi:hypothetical protein
LKRQCRELGFATWLSLLLVTACATSKPVERRNPRAVAAREPVTETVAEAVPETALYAADEALRDVLAGELQYLGTGRWPGVERSRACAFHNDRVLIVNVYCTLVETQAFRVEVFSPERGRVKIYAEANGPVSTRNRSEYFTFMAESGPPPRPETRIRPLAVTMSYQELSDYEQQRYNAYLPGCFAGEINQQPTAGCLGALATQENGWTARNRAFLESPNDDWYRVIRRMRTLTALYGRDRERD